MVGLPKVDGCLSANPFVNAPRTMAVLLFFSMSAGSIQRYSEVYHLGALPRCLPVFHPPHLYSVADCSLDASPQILVSPKTTSEKNRIDILIHGFYLPIY